MKAPSFILVGCSRMRSRCAMIFTGEGVSRLPSTFGTIRLRHNPDHPVGPLSRASSDGTANSGVPMKTMRMAPLSIHVAESNGTHGLTCRESLC